jgi:hypothetical protein
MDLYLAAAYEHEEAKKNTEHMKVRGWLRITRHTQQAYEEALLAIARHRANHGC